MNFFSKFKQSVLALFLSIDYLRTVLIRLLTWPSGKSVYLKSCRLGFVSESGQINDFKIGIHSFLA